MRTMGAARLSKPTRCQQSTHACYRGLAARGSLYHCRVDPTVSDNSVQFAELRLWGDLCMSEHAFRRWLYEQ